MVRLVQNNQASKQAEQTLKVLTAEPPSSTKEPDGRRSSYIMDDIRQKLHINSQVSHQALPEFNKACESFFCFFFFFWFLGVWGCKWKFFSCWVVEIRRGIILQF